MIQKVDFPVNNNGLGTKNVRALDPFSWVLTGIDEVGLWGALFWDDIVFPSSSLWKTHEDTLNTSTSLQAENGSTVVDKVELDVASSSHELPLLLLLGELIILVLLNDRSVGLNDGVDGILGEIKNLVRVTVVLVIEEDSSQTTSLTTVRDAEVAIGPSLELWVVVRVVFVANFLVCSMEMLHVGFVHVARSDIGSSTEPPDTTVSLKITVVEVHGRAEWVLWVHDRRKTTSKEWNALTWGHALGAIDTTLGGSLEGLLWHGSVHDGKVDTSLFKNISTRHDTRHASTTIGTGPAILLEGCFAVNIRNGLGNFELGFAQHFFKLGTHWVVAAVGTVFFFN